MRRLAIALLLITAGCTPPRPQPVPPMPPPPSMVAVTFHVQDGAGQPIANAQIAGVGHIAGQWAAVTNDVGLLLVTLTPDLYDLTITADGYLRRELPANVNDAGTITIGLEFARLFPAEHGPLHICGASFCDEQGAIWDWRGASMFSLFGRFANGEDITPQIRWMQQRGVNVARIFLCWDVRHNATCLLPDFPQQFRNFLATMNRAGLRTEVSVVTEYDQSIATRRTLLQAVYDLAAGQPLVFVESENEPWNRNDDVIALMQGIDRHGVLSAYGLQPKAIPDEPGVPGHWDIPPTLDYGTMHTQRDFHFPTSAKDLQEIRQAKAIPWVDDEPLGVADFIRTGSGARTNDKTAVLSHFGICRLFVAGCTVHSQSGLEGVAPQAGSMTDDIISGISALWQFIPGTASTGTYVRDGLGSFGLANAAAMSTVSHAYGSVVGDLQWVVVPMPRDTFSAQPANGWGIAAAGPVPYVLRLAR